MIQNWSQIFSFSNKTGENEELKTSKTFRRYSESCTKQQPSTPEEATKRTRCKSNLYKTKSFALNRPSNLTLSPQRNSAFENLSSSEPTNKNFNFFPSLRRSKSRQRKSLLTSHVISNNDVTSTRLPLLRSPSMFALENAKEEDLVPARVEDLILRCLKYFDVRTGRCEERDFPKKLFIAHHWFVSSEQLMNNFQELFREKLQDVELKKKIFLAVGFWLREFPQMFHSDPNLTQALRNFQEMARNDPDVDNDVIKLNAECDFGKIQRQQMSKRPNDTNRKLRKYSLVFNHLKAQELAVHISYLEHKCFRRLTVTDYLEYAKRGSIKGILKLERAVVLCNNITHWVQCMILENHSAAERAAAISKFVAIAEKLYVMNNFSTLGAIVGALEHTAIARMHKTMDAVPKDVTKTLERFVELLDSKANYSKYRRAYAQIEGKFKVPILAIILKDLIAVQAANPDKLEGSKINVKKMYMIGGIFEELIRMQRAAFPFEVNCDLVNAVRFALYLEYSEDEIYKLSEIREPRQSRNNTSALSHNSNRMALENIGFADFARYTCQLDTNTMRQHVTNIVNSVFKAYDLDCDGFISSEEFERIARNFQGLDSFSLVDEDGDGFISMQEMMDYFLKLTSTSAGKHEVFQNFQHEFFEATYFHLTYCDWCEKVLWGIVKQGWKCRVCGINCHKSCKSQIVVECRPKDSRDNHEKKKKKKTNSKSAYSPSFSPKTVTALDEDDAFEASSPKLCLTPSSKSATSTPTHHRHLPQTSSQLPHSSSESLNDSNRFKSSESKVFLFEVTENNQNRSLNIEKPPIKRRVAERRNTKRPRSSTLCLIRDPTSSSSSSLDSSKQAMRRCDSGVSGCSSCASLSAPPTPATADQSLDGIRFLYPPVTSNRYNLTPASSDEGVRSEISRSEESCIQPHKNKVCFIGLLINFFSNFIFLEFIFL